MNSNSLKLLDWDSKFLGFSVARLTAHQLSSAELAAILVECQTARIKLVYLSADPVDDYTAQTARVAGARLVDRKITYLKPLPLQKEMNGVENKWDASIISSTTYTTQLEALAWQSGEFSRFRLDNRFAPQVYHKLYSLWLHNSLSGQLARMVLVYRTDTGDELGLLTLGEKNGRADIGLLAVGAASRGKRLGKRLVSAACLQALHWGYSEIQVVTQRDNQLACHFYERCGFYLAHEENIYHLWIG